ncbi:MAG: hypothetical protein A3B10_04050 [Candidatus Doudnabacteria bacterium RIFCSPLOWO2_01_FULL_44_21]|uniref:Uncharacterized protein n=1 Tax=Candidatus Doudnabacteria bacterium RIFCSPLOWO2_01_FULL_44_21 TaxID=1817841 RepID=A0A1F5Q524_9BACT|nr:MAG: hypothetical protein A3B95_00715 [Candidatus Doudnabacteria bacterium RIFCSPHIGHO2_02_FULL_43_13b]OGE97291.1 MAG: hypothetical protein A3B10_04050 [Candidatus Doudnabacteria bacterium RIFCSPLOWO2_01_FULL_44_21]
MRHNSKTVDDAVLAFDWLERQGISLVRPVDFQPVKYGSRTFGQFEAFENKLTTTGVDQILADQATIAPVQPLQTPEPLASFFSATKVSETATEMVFHVKIKRGNRTPQQLLDLTGRRPYTNPDVVETMPLVVGNGQEEDFEYVFFKPGRQTSDAAVETERTMRELIRDLEVQALINALIPAFADQHPNGDSWQDAEGNWCFASFRRADHERCVHVDRCSVGWSSSVWFGGRKVSK